jgi:hypothetical protein
MVGALSQILDPKQVCSDSQIDDVEFLAIIWSVAAGFQDDHRPPQRLEKFFEKYDISQRERRFMTPSSSSWAW